MAATRTPDPAAVITDAIENVFATVAEVRRTAIACHAAVTATRPFADADVRGLAPALVDLLQDPDQVAVGLGIILEPGTLESQPLRLEWWQRLSHREVPTPLEVDLHPDSVAFYDYLAADWFAVPRRTRARHIVGPYVDVHGTGQYLLTFTMPLHADGAFLGVAGADVPVSSFETVVLRRLGSGEAVLANDEGRVVMSTSSRWITGCLLPDEARSRRLPLPRLPWELVDVAG